MGGNGVEVRDTSIRLTFTFEGKSRKETLKTEGEPMLPTPRNVKYAQRLAQEIKDKIKHGTFVYADYFPDSTHATTGEGGTTVGDLLDSWLKTQGRKSFSTLRGYNSAVLFWKAQLGTKLVKSLKKSDILSALATEPKWTGKTVNNKVSVIRQAIQLSVDDKLIQENPANSIKASKHQRKEPDPFSLEEAENILGDIAKHYSPQVLNYFEFKFFTGIRTGESLILKWENVDFNRKEILVEETLTAGQEKDSTKTSRARIVKLNSRAMAVLLRHKQYTFMAGDLIFVNPNTGRRWFDDMGPRRNYWKPSLKRLGVRYRSPYHTRHTYATVMLMSGVAPAYAAKQMGHSVEEFLRTYSRWLDGAQSDLEMGKVEGLLGSSGKNSGKNEGNGGARLVAVS